MEDAFTALDLTGRLAVVTGAGRGIGRAVSDLLTARGADVIRVDVRPEPEGPALVLADVGDPQDCAGLRQVVDERGPLHILVNNAGVGGFGQGIDTADESDWDRVIATNAKSQFMLARALLPALEQAHGACIVNVGSVHALATSAGVAAYAASKGASLALTRALAIDLAPRLIRVIAVLPGATDTDMLAEHAARAGMSLDAMGFSFSEGSVGRVCSPGEVAEVIAFAASPAGSAMTGSAIVADGGLLAGF